MSLLETFEKMASETQNAAPEAQTSTPEDEVIEKYASWAEDTLHNEYGEGNYTAEDIQKLASSQMDADANELFQREKVAEAYEMGQIMYAGFRDAANNDSK